MLRGKVCCTRTDAEYAPVEDKDGVTHDHDAEDVMKDYMRQGTVNDHGGIS